MENHRGATVKLDKRGLREIYILIVEKDSQYSKEMYGFINKNGYNVEAVENAVVALPKLFKKKYDLVISDVNMRGISGINLLELIKKNFPNTEVIITTTQPKLESAVHAIKSGAIDYITKPFMDQEIESKIAQALKAHTKTFEYIRKLGEGSMGIVFLVKHEGKLRALKLIKNEFNRELTQRFLKEGRVVSSLDHPNIIEVLEFGTTHTGKTPYILMEYLEGKTLKELINENAAFTLDQKCNIILQAAKALKAAHQKEIVHRDIKPENIMILKDYFVKIVDFGICQLPDSHQTNMHCIIGSPAYLSPEAFKCPKVSAKADIYSLGVVAYELFLNRRIYDITKSDNVSSIGMNTLTKNPLEPLSLNGNFPYNLQKILNKMLMKDPDRRISAIELVHEFETITIEGFKKKKLFTRSNWNTL